MIRISDIDPNRTDKGDCIQEAVAVSGLPRDVVERYFDSLHRDMKATSEVVRVTWSDVLDRFKSMCGVVSSDVVDVDCGDLGSVIDGIRRSKDTVDSLKRICVVAEMLTGHNLTGDTVLDSDVRDVMNESAIDGAVNHCVVNNGVDRENIDLDTKLNVFNSLKDVLVYNHKYCSHVLGLESTFSVIMDFIDSQIDDIVNSKSVTQRDEEEYRRFIEDLYRHAHIAPHYSSVDYLRTFVSDFTDLLSVILRNNDVLMKKLGRLYKNMVNTELFLNYRDITDVLCDVLQLNDGSVVMYAVYDESENTNFEQMVKSILGTVNILQNIRGEFSLNIRKLLNSYITHTINLVNSYKGVYLRVKQYNQTSLF